MSDPRQVPGYLWCAALLVACTPGAEGEPTPTPVIADGHFEVPQAAVPCESPVTTLQPFRDEAVARGLFVDEDDHGQEGGPGGGPRGGDGGGGEPLYPPGVSLATMAILGEDLDGDLDIDLVASSSSPILYENDGRGYFTRAPSIPGGLFGVTLALSTGDLNGDDLPDLIGVRPPMTPEASSEYAIWLNEGGMRFSEGVVYETGLVGRGGEPSSMTLGDVDGDHDLDFHYTTRTSVPGTPGPLPNRIFLNDGSGRFPEHVEIQGFGGAGIASLVSTFTDREGDGDLDLLVLGGDPTFGFPDHPPSAFFRNDGLDAAGKPQFVDDAAATGLAHTFSAMGVDSIDWNGDGAMDYCATDVGPMRCWESSDLGWIEVGTALALSPEVPVFDWPQTIGWSVDFQDFDNDGLWDVFQASGPDHGGVWQGTTEFPDLVWRQTEPGRFEDLTEELAFGSTDMHFGMVSADFDGEGSIDVFFHAEGFQDEPMLLLGSCGLGHWLEVELLGPRGNATGIGATVEVQWPGGSVRREIHSLRATAQGPSRVHVGLGSAEVAERVTVEWGDGSRSEVWSVPADRIVTAVHGGR